MNNKQKNISTVVFSQKTVAGITARSENSHN